ncbi:MAG: DNA-3-methyladenine glycosylase [Ignavibacteria bacterium]|nr:MAG: DNA-3-methyladenine glycosylase [Ignavibacteria bacterium]KAF0159301.1 MAG: DNA-3-methyladenine glycosylase [Ignavibacteria bacterium]
MNSFDKLPFEFYNRKVTSVAKSLLGKTFVRKNCNEILCGKIVEVEAYDGKSDEASHSYNGATKRNQVMFGKAGHLYVYFTYGMHFCANVVTGKENYGAAILIRAIEPLGGIDILSQNRFGKKNISGKELLNLCSGPAKICQAFQITRGSNGANLCGDDIFILDSPSVSNNKIISTARIGIKKSIDLPWRYYIKDNPYVSKK